MAVNFESESEVKEFIKNIGIEYRFGCYSEKKPEVCHLLGDYLEAIDKNFAKAAQLYKSNCDNNGFGNSCKKYGTYALLGKGMPAASLATAYDYFARGCRLDNIESCLHQGLLLVANNDSGGEGEVIKRDVAEGMALLDRACCGQNANACYYLSGMYISGVKRAGKGQTLEVDKDMAKAFRYSQMGCDLGNIYCCVNLSQMYAKGDGVAKDAKLADKYKAVALEMQKEMQSNQTLEFQQGLT